MAPYFQFSWLLVSYMHAGKGGLFGVLQPPQTILLYPNMPYLLHGGTYLGPYAAGYFIYALES